MFGFGKKIEKDPKKALENADKTLNTGLTGGLTKLFMGKDFVNEMNQSIEKGKEAIDGMQQGQMIAQYGMEAEAEVLSIEDTSQMINFNPVVKLKLKVTPGYGAEFETAGQTMVSKIAIPRVGDKIKIKYFPNDLTQFVVV
jgi:hypothetical protein